MDNHFGGVIWTNHALDRLRERGIKQGDAWATWRNPEQSRRGTVSGSWVYYRNWGNTQIEIVAKQNERREWVIISVWSREIDKSSHGIPLGVRSTTQQGSLSSNKKTSFWRKLYNFIFTK